jgi:probable HAF family extracellular repeat protein
MKTHCFGMARIVLRCAPLLCTSLLLLHALPAAAASYRQVDVPGATNTSIYGINSAGEMVGQYMTETSTNGFLYSNGSFTPINYPGSSDTSTTGINDHGDIVGTYYTDGTHSFLYRNGQFTSIAYPGATSTQANAINNLGDVVGGYVDPSDDSWHAFLLHQGVFTSFEEPGADFTEAYGINEQGVVAGYFHTYCDGSCDIVRGFLFYGGLIHNNAINTELFGINNQNEVVGKCNDARGDDVTGCLFTQDGARDWNYPGMYWTAPTGINDKDVVVGTIAEFSDLTHGFVLEP